MTFRTLELIAKLLQEELRTAHDDLEAIRQEYKYAPEAATAEELNKIRDRKKAAAQRVCAAENALDEFLAYDQW